MPATSAIIIFLPIVPVLRSEQRERERVAPRPRPGTRPRLVLFNPSAGRRRGKSRLSSEVKHLFGDYATELSS